MDICFTQNSFHFSNPVSPSQNLTNYCIYTIELASFMGKFNVHSSHYAISWILTLFSHDISHPLLLTLWDQYIYYGNPIINLFTIVQHLISNRENILSIHSEDVFMIISNLPFENDTRSHLYKEQDGEIIMVESPQTCDPTRITPLVRDSIKLMKQTPPSVIRLLDNLVNMRVEVSTKTLPQYTCMTTLTTTPLEVFTYFLRKQEKNSHCLSYLLIDTRDEEAFQQKHLTSSMNLSPSILQDWEQVNNLIQLVSQCQYHIVVFDNAADRRLGQAGQSRCKMIIQELLIRGCKYVSRMEGGFEDICRMLAKEKGESRMYEFLIESLIDTNSRSQYD